MLTTRRLPMLLLAAIAANPGAAATPPLPAAVPGQVIVGFQPGTRGQAKAELHRQAGARALLALEQIGAVLVEVQPGRVPDAIAFYTKNPNVRYAEPNYLRPLVLPNEGQDPNPPFGLGIDYLEEQWYLDNYGQAFFYDQYTGAPGAISGTPGADIDAPAAWEMTTGSAGVTVAVLDAGVDCNHVDLLGKCVESINLGPSSNAEDQIGHGTHVAGTIAANTDNGIGIAGIAWDSSIANIKVCHEVYDPLYGVLGACGAAASASGMIHAADRGYQVINMSFGGPTGSQAEADAAAYAWNHGVVLVAAAGNSYVAGASYPAAFPEVIGVAASDWHDNLASFSNFGPNVDLMAPGTVIFATMPNAACGLPANDPEGCYGWLSGTSMASPMVAGAAALLWAQLGAGGSNALVRQALEQNGDAAGVMGQNMLAWATHGRLNLARALANGGTPPTPADPGVHVADLDGTVVNTGKNWSASVSITVHTETHGAAAGISVQGSWSGAYSGAASCVTQAGGTCSVATPDLSKRSGPATFTVTGLTGDTYQSGANHDPDGDSDGSRITVSR